MLSSSVYSTDAVVKREVSVNSTNGSLNGTVSHEEYWPPTHLEIVTTMAMAVGLWQVMLNFKLNSFCKLCTIEFLA